MIYELLQRAQFSMQTFRVVKPAVSFPVQNYKLVLYLCTNTMHSNGAILKWTRQWRWRTPSMPCPSMGIYFWHYSKIKQKETCDQHKILSSHLISYMDVWRMCRLQIAPKIHGHRLLDIHIHMHHRRNYACIPKTCLCMYGNYVNVQSNSPPTLPICMVFSLWLYSLRWAFASIPTSKV